jgi:ribosome-binding protein aMBF1 (putative translation factor)
MTNNNYAETIRRAAEHHGGVAKLAERLGVAAEDVRAWCDGSSVPDHAVLIRLADLILLSTRDVRRSAGVIRPRVRI